MNNLGGGLGFYFWSELIKIFANHIRNVGDSLTVKKLRCEGVGAKGLVGASPKGVLFTFGGVRRKPNDDIIYIMRQK